MNSRLIHLQAQAKLNDLRQEALSRRQLPKGRNQLRRILANTLRYFASNLDPQLNPSTA